MKKKHLKPSEIESTELQCEKPEEMSNLSRRGFIAGVAGTAAAALLRVPANAATVAASSSGAKQYRIHPAIGVARMGNADPSTYFIGPEAPGFGPLGDAPGTSPYPKKVGGLVKPQAARFRIWEYQMDANGVWQPTGEVNLSTPGLQSIQWSVHLANKKASFHQFGGPAGESTPPLSLRNATVTDRRTLETDFGARQVGGSLASPVIFQPTGAATDTYPKKPDGTPVISYLGQLRTDYYGRLIALGGQGVANFNTTAMPALPTYANNDNWFDDASDGPVSATVVINGQTYTALGAWLLVAPPDFAPQVANAVTMYDLLYDVAVREIPVPSNNALYLPGGPLNRLTQLQNAFRAGAPAEFPGIVPDFDSEVAPILRNGFNYYYVDSLVPFQHSSLIDPNNGNPDPAYNAQRQFIAGYMRPPFGATGLKGKQTMPHILGDDAYNPNAVESEYRLALTHTQFGLLANWATGPFIPTGTNPPPTPQITPWGLDRAALENCVGGAFFPGIEASWQIRNPSLYMEPFRISPTATSQYYGESGIPIGPGHFSRQMAVPWHADFNDCRAEGSNAWWPGQRPDSVYVESTQSRIDWARADKNFLGGSNKSSHLDMVRNWYKFGFVVYDGIAFVETERNSGIQ